MIDTVIKEQLTSSQIQKIRKDLTVQAYVNQDYGVKPSPFHVYCESTRKLYLPRYYGLANFGTPKLNKLDFGEEINLNFPLTLKDKQKPIVENILKLQKIWWRYYFCTNGYGKTVIGLYLASVLKVKTLVVVHKNF